MALSACGVTIDKKGKEVMEHGLTMFPLSCFDDNLQIYPVPWHWHDEFEFIIITEGIAHIQAENATIPVIPGDAIFINSGVLHSIEHGKCADINCHSLVFHARIIGGSVESIFWQKLITPILHDESFRYLYLNQTIPWQADIIEDMKSAWQAVADEIFDYENVARYHLSRAFRLINSNKPVSQTKVRQLEKLSTERIKTMIEYIEKNYCEDITLEMIADSVSLSKSACLYCFHQRLGTTPIRYLIQLRIEKAAEQLIKSDEPVNKIAINCGFSDISYFSKCFREMKGFTPKEYRKSYNMNKDRTPEKEFHPH